MPTGSECAWLWRLRRQQGPSCRRRQCAPVIVILTCIHIGMNSWWRVGQALRLGGDVPHTQISALCIPECLQSIRGLWWTCLFWGSEDVGYGLWMVCLWCTRSCVVINMTECWRAQRLNIRWCVSWRLCEARTKRWLPFALVKEPVRKIWRMTGLREMIGFHYADQVRVASRSRFYDRKLEKTAKSTDWCALTFLIWGDDSWIPCFIDIDCQDTGSRSDTIPYAITIFQYWKISTMLRVWDYSINKTVRYDIVKHKPSCWSESVLRGPVEFFGGSK